MWKMNRVRRTIGDLQKGKSYSWCWEINWFLAIWIEKRRNRCGGSVGIESLRGVFGDFKKDLGEELYRVLWRVMQSLKCLLGYLLYFSLLFS
jgi:hypothetical protein